MIVVRCLAATLAAILCMTAAAHGAEPGGASLLRANSVSGNNIDSWCSGAGQSNASCTLIRKRRGKIIVAWATSRSSVKKYKFCLRNPRGSTRCVKRPMRETKNEGVWADGFWLNHELETNRFGEYGASWIANGKRVGPILHFRVR